MVSDVVGLDKELSTVVKKILVGAGCDPESDIAIMYAEKLGRNVGAHVITYYQASEEIKQILDFSWENYLGRSFRKPPRRQ